MGKRRHFWPLGAVMWSPPPPPADAMLVQRTIISNADTLALPSTPLPLTPTIAGKYPVFVAAALNSEHSAGLYTNVTVGRNAQLQISDSSNQVSSCAEPFRLFAGGGYRTAQLYQFADWDTGVTLMFGVSSNFGFFGGDQLFLSCNNPLGNFTGGNPANTLTVDVAYYLIDAP